MTDNQRIADALRFYIERCHWPKDDPEKAEFIRLWEHHDELAAKED